MRSTLQKTNVIYECTCKFGDCEHLTDTNNRPTYIGYTTTTLSRRLTMHLQQGAIKTHTLTHHNIPITRHTLVNNTRIIHKENNSNRLQLKEALLKKQRKPKLNKQNTGSERTLSLYTHS